MNANDLLVSIINIILTPSTLMYNIFVLWNHAWATDFASLCNSI